MVDMNNKAKNHDQRTKGGLITMPFIFANEVGEKLAVVGFQTNMISYLTQQLHMPMTKAANTLTNFSGTASLTPLLGAFIADSFAGRFWTITVASIIYQIGMVSLTLAAVLPKLRPPPCKNNEICQEANTGQLAILYISLLLTAIGSGGIRPCVVAFGADQFDETDEKQKTSTWKFFNWYYFCMGASMLVAVTVIVYIQDNVGWGWGLGVPSIAMAVSIIGFVIGYPLYRNMDPAGSPFTRLVQVCVAAYKKRKLPMVSDPKLLYENDVLDASISVSGKLMHTKHMRWRLSFKMSLVDDSLLNSSSIDDFAAYLDSELESTSDTSPEPEEYANEMRCLDTNRIRKRKLEVLEGVVEANGSTSQHETIKTLEASAKEYTCTHPGFIGRMCIKCGEEMVNQSGGIAFGYIHEGLWLANDEIVRLRKRNLKSLFSRKKLCLVLDLDHTLLNSTPFSHITQEEGYLMNKSDPVQDALKGSLFKLKSLRKLVKLRPFVHTFLKEASQLFEMYIYTMAERSYALKMANLLDPQKIYFDSRIIARHDCTQRRQKGLDVVLGQESAVLILDDSHQVWAKDKANLILMEKYNYFASSYINLPYKYKSLSELKYDESESEGTLAIVLQVLKRIHNLFFDPELGDNFAGRDVRQVLMAVRGEILKGCKIAFSCTFLTKSPEQNHRLWNMAEQMGAMCVKEVDPSVTHVVSAFVGTRKSCWAVEQNKFLVEPRWLEAAYYLWQKQPEDKFTVTRIKTNK